MESGETKVTFFPASIENWEESIVDGKSYNIFYGFYWEPGKKYCRRQKETFFPASIFTYI